jgi:hypothetical protein
MLLLGYSRCNRNFKAKFGQKSSIIKILFDIKTSLLIMIKMMVAT